MRDTNDAAGELMELIRGLRGFLEYRRDVLEMEEIPVSEYKHAREEIVEERGLEAVLPGGAQVSFKTPEEAMQAVRDELGECRRCKLWQGRKNIVFGSGNVRARLVFVGEGPGRDEDIQGLPFVGRAGQLLTKIIESIGLTRREVYIANVVKCRPPGNRNPEPDEVASCQRFLMKQLEVIQPAVICALGKFAAQTLTCSTTPITRLRGRFHDFNGIKVMPTFHPAYLLRNPRDKKLVWEDMKMIRRELDELA